VLDVGLPGRGQDSLDKLTDRQPRERVSWSQLLCIGYPVDNASFAPGPAAERGIACDCFEARPLDLRLRLRLRSDSPALMYLGLVIATLPCTRGETTSAPIS
jgi:hypothetical protein